MSCRGVLRGGAVGILAVWLAGSAGASESMPCLSWPGEPVPLPEVNDADPARARWAALRAEDLAREAARAEAAAGAESQRLWRRVLCLDPLHSSAQRGLAETASVRVHRPELRWGVARRRKRDDPLAALSTPVIVQRAPEIDPAALVRGHEQIVAAQRSLDSARFSDALGQARAARKELKAAPASTTAQTLRVRAEVLAATAQLALGDESSAQKSLARALALDPTLALDPQSTSPKVLSALEAAKAAGNAR